MRFVFVIVLFYWGVCFAQKKESVSIPFCWSTQKMDRPKLLLNKKMIPSNGFYNRSLTKTINNFLPLYIESGHVSFRDTFSNASMNIIEKLNGSRSINSQQIEVITVLTEKPVLFSLPNGLIFISLGIYGQLESESQLAFLLGTQLTYIKDLVLPSSFYVESKTENLQEFIELHVGYEENDIDNANLSSMKLMERANYDVQSAFEAVQLIAYANLPFDLIPMMESDYNSQLELDSLSLAKIISQNSFKPKEVKLDKFEENQLKKIEQRATSSDGKTFVLFSPESFKSLMSLARMNICRIFISNNQFVKSLYSNFLLKKSGVDTILTQKIEAHTWYNMVRFDLLHYKTYSPESDAFLIAENSQLYALVKSLNMEEKSFIALKILHTYNRNHNTDESNNLLNGMLELIARNKTVKIDHLLVDIADQINGIDTSNVRLRRIIDKVDLPEATIDETRIGKTINYLIENNIHDSLLLKRRNYFANLTYTDSVKTALENHVIGAIRNRINSNFKALDGQSYYYLKPESLQMDYYRSAKLSLARNSIRNEFYRNGMLLAINNKKNDTIYANEANRNFLSKEMMRTANLAYDNFYVPFNREETNLLFGNTSLIATSQLTQGQFFFDDWEEWRWMKFIILPFASSAFYGLALNAGRIAAGLFIPLYAPASSLVVVQYFDCKQMKMVNVSYKKRRLFLAKSNYYITLSKMLQ